MPEQRREDLFEGFLEISRGMATVQTNSPNQAKRIIADHIHRHRMLPPPACDECLDLAEKALEALEGGVFKCPSCDWTLRVVDHA